MKTCFLLMLFWVTMITAHSQDNKVILVVNKGSHSVSVLDPIALKEIKRIHVGHAPHELTVSADGKLAYVANYGLPGYGNSISVVDIKVGKEIKRISTGSLYRPHCIKLKGDKLYFTSEATRSIAAWHLQKDSITWLAGTGQEGAHMLVLTPDGSKVFVANRVSHTVSSIEVGKEAWPGPIQQIATGNRPEGIDIAPDGKEVWVGNTGEGSVDIIDVTTNKITRHIQVGKVPIRIQFTPDGKKVLISDSGAEELIVLDAASRTVLKKIAVQGAPMGILISADNKTAYISCSNAGEVKVLDLQTMQFTGSIKTGEAPDGIVWGSRW